MKQKSVPGKAPAEQVLKDIRRQTRRHYSAEEKIRIVLEGQDITHLAPNQRVQRGMVRTFQINQLFDSLTPLQTLALTVSQHLGLGTKWWQPLGRNPQVAERCKQLLAQFHLAEVMDQPTHVLAYGKRRLLEIAIALACEPRVLLLDEPVAGVPAGEREELLQTVAALPADVSVLLIEHDMDLVFSFANFMTVLVNGTLLTEGTPEQIANDPQVKAVYLGHGEEAGEAGPPQGAHAPPGGSAAHEVTSLGGKFHG